MEATWQEIAVAFGLGLSTAVLPCPMATNIAAIAFLGRHLGSPWRTLLSGLLYALGGMLAYVGLGIVLIAGVQGSPLAEWLQRHVNQVVGLFLIVLGMLLLELIRPPGVSLGVGPKFQARVARWGLLAALPLGALFALAFCPISAGVFFGNVLRLSAEGSSWLLSAWVYGAGTALPVVALAALVAFSTRWMATTYNAMTKIEWWGQRIAGTVLVLVGIYMSLRYILKAF
jgi:hypothetical protein